MIFFHLFYLGGAVRDYGILLYPPPFYTPFIFMYVHVAPISRVYIFLEFTIFLTTII